MLPLVVLVGAVFTYPVAFVLRLIGFEAGDTVAAGYGRLVDFVFQPTVLPVLLPRGIVVTLLALLVILVTGTMRGFFRTRARRRETGAFWWSFLGVPLNVTRVREWFKGGLWQMMGGAVRVARPTDDDLSERYTELLADNIGQPGFRELILVAHDVDARRDLVFALLVEPHRQRFFPPARWVGREQSPSGDDGSCRHRTPVRY